MRFQECDPRSAAGGAHGSHGSAPQPRPARAVHPRLRHLPQARSVGGAPPEALRELHTRRRPQRADERQDGHPGGDADHRRACRRRGVRDRPRACRVTRRSNQCTAGTPTADPMRGPRWMAWGGDHHQHRYAAQGGLAAQDLPRLKLKWAFAYDGRDVRARASPRLPAESSSPPATTASCTRSTRRPAAPTGPSRRSGRAQRAQRLAVPQRQRHALRRLVRRFEGQRLRRRPR
jgi:hypothetical protein